MWIYKDTEAHYCMCMNGIIESRDSYIRRAISWALKSSFWGKKAVAKRGRFIVYPGADGKEIFEFDGDELIEFYPIRTTLDGYVLTVTQKVRLLYCQTHTVGNLHVVSNADMRERPEDVDVS